jgi:HD domain
VEPVTVEEAIVLAAQCHAGQVDKAGEPYIRHPLRVMEAVAGHGETFMTVAVLHDVVEDTGQLDGDLSLTVTQRGALELLTRRDEPYETYIDRITGTLGIDGAIARRVKLADISDNLARLGALPPEERERLRRRYEAAYMRLREAIAA